MKETNKVDTNFTKTLIFVSAAISRGHNNEIELRRKQIQSYLLQLFPSLGDVAEDWSFDIIDTKNDADVDAILHRISTEEKRKADLLKIKSLNDRLTELEKEVSQIESEISKFQSAL